LVERDTGVLFNMLQLRQMELLIYRVDLVMHILAGVFVSAAVQVAAVSQSHICVEASLQNEMNLFAFKGLCC